MGRPTNIIVVSESYRELAEHFYRYLLRLGYSPKGCRSRYNYLKEFLSWLEQQGQNQVEKTSPADLMRYYGHISERPNKTTGGILDPKTTHGHMRIVRDLFEMLLQEKRVKANPCSTLKFPYPKQSEERTVLSQEEVKELYQVTETAQERAILSLSYGCGLRAGELVNCNVANIRLREKILIVPQGKGNKRRVVPMSSGVVKDLADYHYNEREALTGERNYKPAENAFMLNKTGRRMQKWTFNGRLKEIIERTGNEAIKEKQITTHNLRHSIATHLLEQGMPVEQVRAFLGHSQLETTQLYTRVSDRQIKDLMR